MDPASVTGVPPFVIRTHHSTAARSPSTTGVPQSIWMSDWVSVTRVQ